jgi:hypothetical protein
VITVSDTYEIHTITNNVYYTKAYTYERDGSTDESPLMLVCVPSNGYQRGKKHKFPVASVSHIVVRRPIREPDEDRLGTWRRACDDDYNIDLARDIERGK